MAVNVRPDAAVEVRLKVKSASRAGIWCDGSATATGAWKRKKESAVQTQERPSAERPRNMGGRPVRPRSQRENAAADSLAALWALEQGLRESLAAAKRLVDAELVASRQAGVRRTVLAEVIGGGRRGGTRLDRAALAASRAREAAAV